MCLWDALGSFYRPLLGQVVSKFASQGSPKFAPEQPSWTLGLERWPVKVTFPVGHQLEKGFCCPPSCTVLKVSPREGAGPCLHFGTSFLGSGSLLSRCTVSFPRRAGWMSQLLLFARISWSISVRGSDTRWLKAQARLALLAAASAHSLFLVGSLIQTSG